MGRSTGTKLRKLSARAPRSGEERENPLKHGLRRDPCQSPQKHGRVKHYPQAVRHQCWRRPGPPSVARQPYGRGGRRGHVGRVNPVRDKENEEDPMPGVEPQPTVQPYARRKGTRPRDGGQGRGNDQGADGLNAEAKAARVTTPPRREGRARPGKAGWIAPCHPFDSEHASPT